MSHVKRTETYTDGALVDAVELYRTDALEHRCRHFDAQGALIGDRGASADEIQAYNAFVQAEERKAAGMDLGDPLATLQQMAADWTLLSQTEQMEAIRYLLRWAAWTMQPGPRSD